MNLRGLVEYAEVQAKRSGAPTDKRRTGLWKWILERNPQLVACITSGTTWKESIIPVKIQSLYNTLNKHHHVGKTPVQWTAAEGSRIVEGAKVSILDCQLLHCVCELLGIKAEVVPTVDDVRIHSSRGTRNDFSGQLIHDTAMFDFTTEMVSHVIVGLISQ